MPLNDRQIKNLKPTDKIQKISDGGGLSLVCKPNGGKYWQLNFRFDGKQKTLSIGTYPAISLFEARAAREQAKQQLANGIDPAAAKQQAKRERKTATANSFEKIAREWHQNQLPRWTGTHAARVLHSLETDAFPILGKYPITEIKAPLLLEAVRAIEARGVPETATRVLQRIKSVFNYAIQTGRAAENPAFALSGVIVREKVKHQPALPQSGITEFYRRLIREPMRQENRIAMMLIMLTFVRAGNIRFAEWEEIDKDKRLWVIPAEKMKMRAAHIVHLSDWALELLESLYPMTGYSRYLFPNYKDSSKPMSENTLSYAMGRMGYSGIATPHVFRSLATDVLNENGFPPDVIERQLAHVEQNKVRAAYHRTEYLPQRIEMMQWYSDFLRERHNQARAMIESETGSRE